MAILAKMDIMDIMDIKGIFFMRTMTSTHAKNNFGSLLDAVRREPVLLMKNGKPAAMIVSVEDLQDTRFAEMLAEFEANTDNTRKHSERK